MTWAPMQWIVYARLTDDLYRLQQTRLLVVTNCLRARINSRHIGYIESYQFNKDRRTAQMPYHEHVCPRLKANDAKSGPSGVTLVHIPFNLCAVRARPQ